MRRGHDADGFVLSSLPVIPRPLLFVAAFSVLRGASDGFYVLYPFLRLCGPGTVVSRETRRERRWCANPLCSLHVRAFSELAPIP